jgi:hypothetical protein
MKKGKKSAPTSVTGTLLLVAAILALTALRIAIATSGSMTEGEAFLQVCSFRPAGAYAEGPAGIPLLLSLLQLVGLTGLTALRWISPLCLLPLSWCVWWIARRLAPHRAGVALWSALGFNLLPPVNLASLVFNGAVPAATLLLLAAVTGWRAATLPSGRLAAWALFGAVMAVATQFRPEAGLLVPAAMVLCFIRGGFYSLPWKGILAAVALLALGSVPMIAWNVRHDWIQWAGIAPAFDMVTAWGWHPSLGTALILCALLTPILVRGAFLSPVIRVGVGIVALVCLSGTVLIFAAPAFLPSGLPDPSGVSGVEEVASEVMALRTHRLDPKGRSSILIAQTPGLASLVGSRIRIDYPERQGSPSVFVAESPSMGSSYALWPSYADAVAAAEIDRLYTQEKSTSPFLGRNALYLSAESREELPQTITGSFDAVALLKEVPIRRGGRSETLRIYQCESYHPLAL